MSKRPRISDNDPLNRTQKALERFPSNQLTSQPVSKSLSQQGQEVPDDSTSFSNTQQVDNTTSGQDNNIIDNPTSTSPAREPTSLKVNKSTIEQESLLEESASGQVSNITSQQVQSRPKDSNFTSSQQVDNKTSGEDDNIVDTPTSTSTSSPARQSTSLKVNKLTIEQESFLKESSSQQADKSSSQQEKSPTLELKKATFQLDKAVLTKLEKFVLSLQLDLGKEKAPYKEIVVEEAIELFLKNDPSKILKALERRQKKRKK